MSTSSPSNSESLFSSWLAKRESSEAPDFEAYCEAALAHDAPT